MTTIDTARPTTARPTTDTTAERGLRRVLNVDVVVSAVSTTATIVASGPISDLLDVPRLAVLVVCAGLVGWVVGLAILARTDHQALVRHTPSVIAGNLAWAVLTPVLLVAGAVDGASWWLLGAAAVVVADLGLAQWWFWRRLR